MAVGVEEAEAEEEVVMGGCRGGDERKSAAAAKMHRDWIPSNEVRGR